MSIFVCPVPRAWSKAYLRLEKAWKESGNENSPPPKHLALSGWSYSSDFEKKARWEETVSWAKEHQLDDLIPTLTPEDEYRVDVLRESNNPEFGEQFCEAHDTPKGSEIIVALKNLKDDWENITGSELATVTYPIRFTGRKRRRLLVAADESIQPQWGSWTCISTRGNRRSFSRFRAAINQAKSPLSVDHVDFVPCSADNLRHARS